MMSAGVFIQPSSERHSAQTATVMTRENRTASITALTT